MKDVGVALVTYNRPEHTAKVLRKLKKYRIEPLYIFSDGPKNERDAKAVTKVRDLIRGDFWGNRNPTLVISEKNRGLAKSIVGAVDFVLKRHKTVILLEDDCLPGPYLFDFMYDCLAKYKDDERMFGITGYTVPIPQEILRDYPYDVYFFPRIGSWGWATWRSRWKHYRRDLSEAYREALNRGINLNQGGKDIPGMIEAVLNRNLDAWTMGWQTAMLLSNGMYVYPTVSHIENIGMDGTGVHTGKTDRWETPIATEKASRFPKDIVLDQKILRHYEACFAAPNKMLSLNGERGIEIAFIEDRLPPGSGRILDLGPDTLGQLSLLAMERGYDVEAIGIEKRTINGLNYTRGDFLEIYVNNLFDTVFVVSTIEHLGLAGRYGVKDDNENADLEGMKKLQTVLKPNGTLLLTIPVGQDATISPWHRIYGRKRLPLLLNGYKVIEEKYWAKGADDTYSQVDKENALSTYPCRGPHFYYALGQFTLKVNHPKAKSQVFGFPKAVDANIYYCTYTDRGYLPKLLALHESMQEHCRPYDLWVLAIDETTETILLEMDLPNVTVVGMNDFVDNAIMTAKDSGRRWDEFLWGLTPSWILFVLRNAPGIEAAIYLDADSCFYSHPEPVLKELGYASIGIVPHRFASEHTKNFIYGVFNVNGVYARKDPTGLACMRRWRHQCNKWCYRRFEDGKFCDQKYLETWPAEFGAHVIEHIGWNLMPQNQIQYDYSPRGKEIYVNEEKVIMYHFHALVIEDDGFNLSPYRLAAPVKNYIYSIYTDRLSRAITDIQGTQLVIPDEQQISEQPVFQIHEQPIPKPTEQLAFQDPDQPSLPAPASGGFDDWILATNRQQTDGLTAKHLQDLLDLAKEHRPDIIVDVVSGCGLSLRTWLLAKNEEMEIVAVGEKMDEIYESWRKLPIDLSRMRWAKRAIESIDFAALWKEDEKVLLYFTLHDKKLEHHILIHAIRKLPAGSIVVVNDIQHRLFRKRDVQYEVLRLDELVVLRI